MWKRLRRRSLAPGRPAIYPEQLGLALITVIVLVGGLYAFVRVVFS
jgi:hypothetical protein